MSEQERQLLRADIKGPGKGLRRITHYPRVSNLLLFTVY